MRIVFIHFIFLICAANSLKKLHLKRLFSETGGMRVGRIRQNSYNISSDSNLEYDIPLRLKCIGNTGFAIDISWSQPSRVHLFPRIPLLLVLTNSVLFSFSEEHVALGTSTGCLALLDLESAAGVCTDITLVKAISIVTKLLYRIIFHFTLFSYNLVYIIFL